jgi:GTP-binding protein Era
LGEDSRPTPLIPDQPEGFRSGFVALIGRPNVGKSTLLNHMAGQKLAIVSDKPQTTRNKILGIISGPEYQVIFLDTPGIHKPRHKLGEYMVNLAQRTLAEVDLIVHVVEAQAPLGPGDVLIARKIIEAKTPALLAVNKIDLLHQGELAGATDRYAGLGSYKSVVPISATEGTNLDVLLRAIIDHLEEGPRYYPEDVVTDQPERAIVAELVREQILRLTREEVPHSVALAVEEMSSRPNNMVYIKAIIFVERDSQKGIIIGEGGRMLKEIGQQARQEVESLLGSPVYLDLWVKVNRDWRNSPEVLRMLGYYDQK